MFAPAASLPSAWGGVGNGCRKEAAVILVVGVIPARYGSTRFPGKPLAPILGRPMIQWVYERALVIPGVDRVLAATDDERIARAVEAFGGMAVMTSPGCPSGSDRVFEAVRDLPCEVVLNLQGDEPTLDPVGVGALVSLMRSSPDLQMGTLVAPLTRPEDYENPNVVKVALGEGGRCLYFSRSPVPHSRDRAFQAAPLWRHIGIYAYRKEFLATFTGWPTGASSPRRAWSSSGRWKGESLSARPRWSGPAAPWTRPKTWHGRRPASWKRGDGRRGKRKGGRQEAEGSKP